MGALLAHCMLAQGSSTNGKDTNGGGSETKQARKILAHVLNESSCSWQEGDQMLDGGSIDVPLNTKLDSNADRSGVDRYR